MTSTPPLNLLAISGSLRAESSNTAILRALPHVADTPIHLDLYSALAALPHFSPDLDTDPPPLPVQQFRDAITHADAVVICSPEYAHGMPGSLKNALDWLVSWPGAVNKPVMLISASPGGAPYSHAQLLEVLRTMNLQVIDAGAHVFSRSALDETGRVIDAAILNALETAIAQLRDLIPPK